MTVYLLALYSESLTYTIAKALSYVGHQVIVCVADGPRDKQSRWSLSAKIATIPHATVVTDLAGTQPTRADWLIVQGHPLLMRHGEAFDRLAARADRITVVSAGDRSRAFSAAMKLQWRERLWYGRWFTKVRRIAYKDGPHRIDLLGLTRPRTVVGFDAHSMFLQDDALFRAIHADDWSAQTMRTVRINFVGSRDPDSRARILDSIAHRISQSITTGNAQRVVWHVYSDAQPAALPPGDFLKILTDSDFTLAPRGYSLVTHRPVEALLRGSIPVLCRDELDLYGLKLADGVNCIAVEPNSWPAAIDRCLRMSNEHILEMRSNVAQLVPRDVRYPQLARGICQRLGLPDPPRMSGT